MLYVCKLLFNMQKIFFNKYLQLFYDAWEMIRLGKLGVTFRDHVLVMLGCHWMFVKGHKLATSSQQGTNEMMTLILKATWSKYVTITNERWPWSWKKAQTRVFFTLSQRFKKLQATSKNQGLKLWEAPQIARLF